jgi:hypothetical protein
MVESWIWQLSPTDFKIALTCLLMANWRDGEWFDGQKRVPVPRGSFVSSHRNIAKSAGKGITYKMVRGCLGRLVGAEFLKLGAQRGKRYSSVTIVNYDKYQNLGDAPGELPGELVPNMGELPGTKRATIEEPNKLKTEERKKLSPETGEADSQPVLNLGIEDSHRIPRDRFAELYSKHYPKKTGRTKGLDRLVKLGLDEAEFQRFAKCLEFMATAWSKPGVQVKYCPGFEPFVNGRKWLDEQWPAPFGDSSKQVGAADFEEWMNS